MKSESLSEKIEKARSRPPLTEEERRKALETLDELYLKIETNNVRVNILKRLMNEDDIYFDGIVSEREYKKISKEWEMIYEIISKNCLNKIRFLIEHERENNPDNYLSRVENKMIMREYKIREFFTFNRYLNRRKDSSEKDYIKFIKDMALKNDAYEFLEALRD
jgi:hypothetical protein